MNNSERGIIATSGGMTLAKAGDEGAAQQQKVQEQPERSAEPSDGFGRTRRITFRDKPQIARHTRLPVSDYWRTYRNCTFMFWR